MAHKVSLSHKQAVQLQGMYGMRRGTHLVMAHLFHEQPKFEEVNFDKTDYE